MPWCLALLALVCTFLAPGTASAGAAAGPCGVAAAAPPVAWRAGGPGVRAQVLWPPTRAAGAAPLGDGPAPLCTRAAGPTLDVRAGPSSWRSPLRPLVVRRFFEPPPERWLPGHRGVDLAGRPGQLVLAAGAGTVTFAAPLAGRGVVTVSHGSLRTTYEPVEPLVAVGDTVLAGSPIAKLDVGHSPSTGFEARLHWGLLRGRTYLDPLLLLGARRSRLLPVWSDPVTARVERHAAEPPDVRPAFRPELRSGPREAGARGSGAVAVGSSAAAAAAAVAVVAVSRSRRRRPP